MTSHRTPKRLLLSPEDNESALDRNLWGNYCREVPGFPGFEHIYSFKDPLSKRPLRGKFDTKIDPLGLTRGEITTAAEIIPISWEMGGPLPFDLVWTTSAHPVIVNRRVIDLLQDCGALGWRTYAVNVTDKTGKLHQDFAGLTVLGRCGAVDLSRSAVVLSKYPGGWFPHFLGHYFPEDSWDGNDIFMEEPDSAGQITANIFVTEKVRKAFDKAKIQNLRFQSLTEMNVMTSIYEIGRSHLLPQDFSRRVDAAYARAGVPRPD